VQVSAAKAARANFDEDFVALGLVNGAILNADFPFFFPHNA